jgi:hypothetical protein
VSSDFSSSTHTNFLHMIACVALNHTHSALERQPSRVSHMSSMWQCLHEQAWDHWWSQGRICNCRVKTSIGSHELPYKAGECLRASSYLTNWPFWCYLWADLSQISSLFLPSHLATHLTMIEPMTIVGGVAATLHLAEFGYKFVRRLSDLPEDIRSSPDSIQSLLEDVDGFLHWAHTFKVDPSKLKNDKALESTIRNSVNTAAMIRRVLQPLLVKDGEKRRARLRKSLIFQHKKRRINRLIKDMNTYQGTLTFYFTGYDSLLLCGVDY